MKQPVLTLSALTSPGVLNKCLYGSFRPEVLPLTLLYTIFDEKGNPFDIPCLQLCVPLNCCKCTVF